MACGIFLNEKDELLRLVINSVRNDLISRNEAFQCLALEFIANGTPKGETASTQESKANP